jgi:flagellar biosynthetic protein FliP
MTSAPTLRLLMLLGVVAGGCAVAQARQAAAQDGRDAYPVVAAAVQEAADRQAGPTVTPTALVTQTAAPPLGLMPSGATAGGAPPAAAGGATPPRPLADWRVLLAISAAFAVLASLRFVPRRRPMPLPPDVFEVLGSASLGGPHPVRIVRFGPKTLLVSMSASGCTTLAEITDPQATACIAAACRGVEKPLRSPPPTMPGGLKGVAAACLLAVLGGAALAAPGADDVDVPATVVAGAPAVVAVAAAPEASPGSSAAWISPATLQTVLPSALLFGVMSLAPAVLLMTTCFVRMSVVLALLRQGLGTAQVPSNQILAALAIFLSGLVMWPVWSQAWRDGVEPYQRGAIAAPEAFDRGSLPIRRWMATQIEAVGNRDTMLMFLARHPDGPRQAATYDDVPVEALLPAFLVSELETAFTIGFRVLLPFLVIDILVATLAVSTGLVMLPPTLVSLPLKLLVFVAADGWTLVVQSLLDGVRTTTV